MVVRYCAIRRQSPFPSLQRWFSCSSINGIKGDRVTLSSIWVPSGGVSETDRESGHDKLIRAGFLRQAQSGIFHLLPLGTRVQDKIGKLIDKHMESIGASRLALSTITTEKLWRKSERLDKVASELFRLKDRRDVPLMLAPTHEEEITTLVASTLKSYKELPLRLYQTTRKYRDEARPRQGLLRSREFIMKDLYSFDVSYDTAIASYEAVSAAYRAIFAEMKLPVLIAEASSGDMGGDYSHEYHLAHNIGEDTVAHCRSCGYTANDEVAVARNLPIAADAVISAKDFAVWRGITKDQKTLVNAWYPRNPTTGYQAPNLQAIKKLVPDLDTQIGENLALWTETISGGDGKDITLVNIVDYRLAKSFETTLPQLPVFPANTPEGQISQRTVTKSAENELINIVPIAEGDACPRCETGTLAVQRALELAHTFYLGTRYSVPLEANTTLPSNPSQSIPLQMGCYGIGVSRIFGAVAELKADSKGLNWPRAIAPFEVVMIPTSDVTDETWHFFDELNTKSDIVLDDRKKPFGWKMQDADLIGYPVIVILGKAWRDQGICEVQCRSLGVKEKLSIAEAPAFIAKLLNQI